ncbi:hypothetical protein D3C71_1816750 [compost metagenome]
MDEIDKYSVSSSTSNGYIQDSLLKKGIALTQYQIQSILNGTMSSEEISKIAIKLKEEGLLDEGSNY